MKRALLLAAALAGTAPGAVPAQSRALDWTTVGTEAMGYFEDLLRIDTSNPPGNETRAADYLRGVLARNGIDSELFALDPARANLVARIRGNGSKRPVLVMGHTDVVGAQPENWSVDPFAAVTRDGYVYGRGSLDDKDNVTAGLMLLLLLERSGLALDRDVVLLAESGEEGTTRWGIDHMVGEHWDAIDAEYCLAEGGGAVSVDGRVRYVNITTTEKFPMRVRLVARGTAGHGSVPRLDNAVALLAGAVARVSAWQTPMRLNETTRAYFERLAEISPPEAAARYRGLADPARRPGVERWLAQNEPEHYSLLRTSVVPTMMSAGFRVNVIPTEAEATFDIRGLPDEDPEAFYRALADVVDDPRVEVEPQPIYRPASAPSHRQRDVQGARGGDRAALSGRHHHSDHAHRCHRHGAGTGAGHAVLRVRARRGRGGHGRGRRRARRRRADPGELAPLPGAVPVVRGHERRRDRAAIGALPGADSLSRA